MLIKPHQEVEQSRLTWNWLLKRRESMDFLPESPQEKKKRDTVCFSEHAKAGLENTDSEKAALCCENIKEE